MRGRSARAPRKVTASNKFDLPTPLAPATHVNGPNETSTSARFLNPLTFSRVNMVHSRVTRKRGYFIAPYFFAPPIDIKCE